MNSCWNCSITVISPKKWTRKLTYQWGLVDVFIFPTAAPLQMIVAKIHSQSSELAFGACTAWPISENDSGKLFTIFLFFAVRHNDEFRLGKSCSGIFHAIYFFFHDINQTKAVGGLCFPPTELRGKRFGNVRNDEACFSCLFQFLLRSS